MNVPRLVMTFFDGTMEDVCAVAQRVMASRSISIEWRELTGPMVLHAIRDELPPPDGPPSAAFLRSAACAGRTAFQSRMEDGWYTLVNAMIKHSPNLEAVHVGLDLLDSAYPSTAFEVFRGGKSMRRVHAWLDDGWHFVQRGEPLAVEDPSNYSRRLISDRLNATLLDGILSRLDIDLTGLLHDRLEEVRFLVT